MATSLFQDTREDIPRDRANLDEQFFKALEAKDAITIRNLVKKSIDPNAIIKEVGLPPLHCLAL
jgi:hypothetical protein